MRSTKGRPRQVTDAQVAAILEWHRTHKPIRVFAREIGLSKSAIWKVIKCNGQYKQPSPENRQLVLNERQRRFQQLRLNGWL